MHCITSKKENLIWNFLSVVVIILAGYLRFSGLGYESIWIDEGYTYGVSQLPLNKLIVPFDVHPPLFYIIESFFVSPEVGEEWLRLPAALFGMLTVILVYLIANNFFGARGAFIVTVFIGFSFAHLTYSADARNYTMLLFLFSISCFSLARLYQYCVDGVWSKYKANTLLLLYFVSSVGCLYTHNIAVIYLLVLNIVTLIFTALHWRTLKKKYILGYIALNVGIFICWIPWFRVVLGTEEGFNWLVQPSIKLAAYQFFALLKLNHVILWLAIPSLLCLAIASVYAVIKSDNVLRIIILTTVIAIPLTVFGVGYLKPMYMERTILPILLGFALCLGFFVSDIQSRTLSLAVIILFTIFYGLSAFEYQNRVVGKDNIAGKISQDWRGAVRSGNKNEAFIVGSVVTAAYYLRDEQKIYIYDNGEILLATLDNWIAYSSKSIRERRLDHSNFAKFLRQNTKNEKDNNLPLKNETVTIIEITIPADETHSTVSRDFLLRNGYELKETVTLAGLILYRYILKS